MGHKKLLVIFGTGEIGELAKYYFENDSPYKVVGFTADDAFVDKDSFLKLPLVPFSRVKTEFPVEKFEMHVALSYKKLNQVRAQKYYTAKSLGYRMASYVSSKSVTWPDLSIGDNCFILENQTIQPTVKIGNNVMIWSGNHLGHGAVIKDHCYISSHVVICGHAEIGERCFLGVNATIKDFVKLGSDTFVTMGALVTQDTQEGDVVLAAKGKIFKSASREASMIKKKYFSL